MAPSAVAMFAAETRLAAVALDIVEPWLVAASAAWPAAATGLLVA